MAAAYTEAHCYYIEHGAAVFEYSVAGAVAGEVGRKEAAQRWQLRGLEGAGNDTAT